MLITVFVITALFIKSFTVHITGEPINTCVHGHVVISTLFVRKCLCTHSTSVQNTRVFVHVFFVVCSVTETLLALVTIKLESSCMEIHMTCQVTFVVELLVTFHASKSLLRLRNIFLLLFFGQLRMQICFIHLNLQYAQ